MGEGRRPSAEVRDFVERDGYRVCRYTRTYSNVAVNPLPPIATSPETGYPGGGFETSFANSAWRVFQIETWASTRDPRPAREANAAARSSRVPPPIGPRSCERTGFAADVGVSRAPPATTA